MVELFVSNGENRDFLQDLQLLYGKMLVLTEWKSIKKKTRKDFHLSSFSTQSRGRTGTGVNLLVFETSASTDSAIWAKSFVVAGGGLEPPTSGL